MVLGPSFRSVIGCDDIELEDEIDIVSGLNKFRLDRGILTDDVCKELGACSETGLETAMLSGGGGAGAEILGLKAERLVTVAALGT